MNETENKKSYLVVYTIVERRDKKYWTRVGAAFPNQDGSINVSLDAVPMSGDLQIREPHRPDDPRPPRHSGMGPQRHSGRATE